MQNTRFIRLRFNCNAALGDDNLEKCLSLLSENLKEEVFQSIYAGIEREEGDLIAALDNNQLTQKEYAEQYVALRKKQIDAMFEFVEKLTPADVLPNLDGVYDRILIVKCKNSPTNWETLFPNDRFIHLHIITFGEAPPREFKNSDVIIFDDLNCPGLIGNRSEMKRLATEMPLAHLLYFGDARNNPFMESKMKDEQEIYGRMGNANTHITLHARLKELLEFRQIFGPPLQTYIVENMKDKLPLRAFISYSHRDEDYKNELDLHLATMKRQGLLKVWQDRKIQPGSDWDDEIKRQMEDSHLIFFMVSPGFMGSDYIMEKEVPHAMSLHAAGKAKVVPIFVKHVEWKGTEFGRLQGLPRDEKFIDTQPNKDQAFATVARELRELIEHWGA
jgi:hypothetical protein